MKMQLYVAHLMKLIYSHLVREASWLISACGLTGTDSGLQLLHTMMFPIITPVAIMTEREKLRVTLVHPQVFSPQTFFTFVHNQRQMNVLALN